MQVHCCAAEVGLSGGRCGWMEGLFLSLVGSYRYSLLLAETFCGYMICAVSMPSCCQLILFDVCFYTEDVLVLVGR